MRKDSSCTSRTSATDECGRPAISPSAASRTATRSPLPRSSARIERTDGPILTTTEILISPEDDAEVRRVHLTNAGRSTREIEITSYAEVVLADPGGRLRAPGVLQDVRADRIRRRRRRHAARDAAPPRAERIAALDVSQCACSRAKASVRSSSRPIARAFSAVAAMCAPRSPSSMHCRCPIRRARCSIRCWRCGAGCAFRPAGPRASTSGPASRAAAPPRLPRRAKYREAGAFERIAVAAADQARAELKELGIDADDARRFQRIAGHVLYPDRSLARRAVDPRG